MNKQTSSHHLKNFTLSYKDVEAGLMHLFVKQLNGTEFEIFVQEKDVIITCTKNQEGVLSCKLNNEENPTWVDGISKVLARRLVQYRGKF